MKNLLRKKVYFWVVLCNALLYSHVFALAPTEPPISGSLMYPNQVPAEWHKLFSYSSDSQGSGEFYLNLQGDGRTMRSLEILKNRRDSANKFVYEHYRTVYVTQLNSKTLLFTDPKYRPVNYLRSRPGFSDKTGGEVILSVLSRGSMMGPENDKFTDVEFIIKNSNGSVSVEISDDKQPSISLPFQKIEFVTAYKFGFPIGVDHIIFSAGTKKIVKSMQSK